MPPSFTYPGVYVSEKESGARAVPAAATSIAMFVGMADMGPFEKPTRVQSLESYQRKFGETSGGEMALQVAQFFINGGGDAYVMRIADGAREAAITLQNEAGANVLTITARDKGALGNRLRIEIDYGTASPGRTFNLTAYRSVSNSDGTAGREDVETFTGLSMDPDHPRNVVSILASESTLVTATNPAAAGLGDGVSVGGLVFEGLNPAATTTVDGLFTTTSNAFRVSVNHLPSVDVTVPIGAGSITDRIDAAIANAYNAQQGVTFTNPPSAHFSVWAAGGTPARLFELRSADGPVVVSPVSANDVAGILQLGTVSGGAEFDAYSQIRPKRSGLSLAGGTGSAGDALLANVIAFANQNRDALSYFLLSDPSLPAPLEATVALTGDGGIPIAYETAAPTDGIFGSLDHVRTALDEVALAINAVSFARWNVSREGLALVLKAANGVPSTAGIGVTLQAGTDPDPDPATLGEIPLPAITLTMTDNVSAYTLGSAGSGAQVNPVPGENGSLPDLGDYQDAFAKIDSEVEIFNIMVLPRAAGQSDVARQTLWGAASAFCAQQRAILLVDPQSGWTNIDAAEIGADAAKAGVDTRHSVAYWPRVLVPTDSKPSGETIDPSGSLAGLYARTDNRFGTWRAPAGIEATLTGVVGLENRMSDAENGRLNPKALNAVRLFPSGITSWGARMMVGADDTGNVDDKYVNVRRMMLLIENSLYRGLRFAVFRNNAEPLWSGIRLAAGSFMNGLMLQGAFASKTQSEAFYVRCDATTTTPTDVNLGIVNVIVGFAPNKPAEFIHLTVTQIAGQTEI